MTDFLTGGAPEYKKTFFNHVFSTTEEGKAELLNIIQYINISSLRPRNIINFMNNMDIRMPIRQILWYYLFMY
jgi:hypothetical protein